MSKAGRGKDDTVYPVSRIICKTESKWLDFTEEIFWSLLKMQKSSSIVQAGPDFCFSRWLEKS